MFSRIAGGLQTVAATAVQITRTALEDDGEFPQGVVGDDSGGEAGMSVQQELDAYKSMVMDMEMQQVKVSREYQALFAEQEVRLCTFPRVSVHGSCACTVCPGRVVAATTRHSLLTRRR